MEWPPQSDGEQEKGDTYSASFRKLELRIWESNGAHPWSVTDSMTREVMHQGEAADLESAMVAAAQAAEADWGSVRWRGSEEDDEPDGDLTLPVERG